MAISSPTNSEGALVSLAQRGDWNGLRIQLASWTPDFTLHEDLGYQLLAAMAESLEESESDPDGLAALLSALFFSTPFQRSLVLHGGELISAVQNGLVPEGLGVALAKAISESLLQQLAEVSDGAPLVDATVQSLLDLAFLKTDAGDVAAGAIDQLGMAVLNGPEDLAAAVGVALSRDLLGCVDDLAELMHPDADPDETIRFLSDVVSDITACGPLRVVLVQEAPSVVRTAEEALERADVQQLLPPALVLASLSYHRDMIGSLGEHFDELLALLRGSQALPEPALYFERRRLSDSRRALISAVCNIAQVDSLHLNTLRSFVQQFLGDASILPLIKAMSEHEGGREALLPLVGQLVLLAAAAERLSATPDSAARQAASSAIDPATVVRVLNRLATTRDGALAILCSDGIFAGPPYRDETGAEVPALPMSLVETLSTAVCAVDPDRLLQTAAAPERLAEGAVSLASEVLLGKEGQLGPARWTQRDHALEFLEDLADLHPVAAGALARLITPGLAQKAVSFLGTDENPLDARRGVACFLSRVEERVSASGGDGRQHAANINGNGEALPSSSSSSAFGAAVAQAVAGLQPRLGRGRRRSQVGSDDGSEDGHDGGPASSTIAVGTDDVDVAITRSDLEPPSGLDGTVACRALTVLGFDEPGRRLLCRQIPSLVALLRMSDTEADVKKSSAELLSLLVDHEDAAEEVRASVRHLTPSECEEGKPWLRFLKNRALGSPYSVPL